MSHAPLRALSWLLLAAFVFASLPTVTIHAHPDAASGHFHHGDAAHPDRDDDSPVDGATDQSATPASLHVHDVSLVFAPTAWPVLVLGVVRTEGPASPILRDRGGGLRPPLHRPPIA